MVYGCSIQVIANFSMCNFFFKPTVASRRISYFGVADPSRVACLVDHPERALLAHNRIFGADAEIQKCHACRVYDFETGYCLLGTPQTKVLEPWQPRATSPQCMGAKQPSYQSAVGASISVISRGYQDFLHQDHHFYLINCKFSLYLAILLKFLHLALSALPFVRS
jgi:hypothetical protein